MTSSYEKANKIRNELLLFIDKEIRKKPSNLSYLIKTQKDYNSLDQIKFEQIFSYTDKNIYYHENRSSKNHGYLFIDPAHDYSKESITKTKLKKFNCESDNRLISINYKKRLGNKIITLKSKKDIEIKNKKKLKTILLNIKGKLNEANSKKYLEILCRKLINRRSIKRRESIELSPKIFKRIENNIIYTDKIERTSKIWCKEIFKNNSEININNREGQN